MADVVWRVDSRLFAIAMEILKELLREEEWSDRYFSLLDDIKSLPGFPLHYSEEHDTIIVQEVAAPRVAVPRLN